MEGGAQRSNFVLGKAKNKAEQKVAKSNERLEKSPKKIGPFTYVDQLGEREEKCVENSSEKPNSGGKTCCCALQNAICDSVRS